MPDNGNDGTVTNCHGLKMRASNGPDRTTAPRRLAEADFAEGGPRKPEENFHRLMQPSPPLSHRDFLRSKSTLPPPLSMISLRSSQNFHV